MSQDSSVALLHDAVEQQQAMLVERLVARVHEDPVLWREEIESILARLDPSLLTHRLLRRLEKSKILVNNGISFHRFMVEDSEARKMGVISPGWRLNRKTRAYRFIDELGVRRPKTTDESKRFSSLVPSAPSVVKAVSGTGGRGTYLVHSDHQIRHVADGKTFSSWSELESHANALMSGRDRRVRDKWIHEELILEDQANGVPGRDSKFFCFYGEVLFSLDVIRGESGTKYAFSTPDGTAFSPGSWDYDYFKSPGPTEEQLQLVAGISSEIPHPFMRIDMLLGEDELVFGEFTPRPGQFHKFAPDWDRKMGEAWLRARARIQDDLLAGKRFDAYARALAVR